MLTPVSHRPETDLARLTYCVLGLPFDAVTMEQAVAVVEEAVISRRRCFISTPNVNFAIAARHDRRFRSSVLQSDLVLADGQPVVWAAKLAGTPISERVSGAGLFEKLRQDARVPIKVYFFGGPEGAAQAAHDALNRSAGHMHSVGFCSPGFGSTVELSKSTFIDPINDAGPDFLVVALGAAKGQDWILANLDRLQAPVISHLGAVVNFTAGTVQRAPQWIQNIGGEWLWRIAQEPKLWRRYWNDGLQLLRMAFSVILPTAFGRLIRSSEDKNGFSMTCQVEGESVCIKLSGNWTDTGAATLADTLSPLLGHAKWLKIEASGLTNVSPRIHAQLLQLEGAGIELRISDAHPRIRRTLTNSNCRHWLVS
jgi:N-acetylglucosaminyldiphosphoundecaprenol N-acetyl-beta-D-mannosaminyltransferase